MNGQLPPVPGERDLGDVADRKASASGDELLPGDTYQEGPYLVFTAQYHLRRGYCCNSGCRHCPYR